ncbi:hypothetical protein [Erythrobacter sp. QSSC1-22B]|uniref:hypothetical protein n=1 Tax=Erythrobacter sp. QSSC1-22B TaxID=1860125 RepID=UPI0011A58940|nr:hypothetical protein [Erythrobacter sp. QSSC1-22B]
MIVSPAPDFAQAADAANLANVDATTGETGFVLDLKLVENACADADLETTISNEIVVCAQVQDQRDYVLQSREEARQDYATSTMDAGNPLAPDLSPPPCVPSLISFCPKLGGPVPRSIETDFSKLPEAPAGSDADRISQGLAPQGN